MENTFIEFFAGIGLMRIALEKLGWKCVFANEMNTVKCGIYDSNFGQPNITRGDISTVDESIIPTARMATPRRFNCTTASSFCIWREAKREQTYRHPTTTSEGKKSR